MFTISEEMPVQQLTKYFGTAKVLDFNEKERTALLKLERMEEECNTWSKLAIPYQQNLVYGDIVLAAGDDINRIYIIGVLNHSSFNDINIDRLTLKNGVYAAVNKNQNRERMQLCNKSGELIFEYDPATGNSRVNIQSGDLEFITKKGNINFISEEDIHFKSGQSIKMESLFGIQISITDTIGKILSSISFKHRKIKLSSSELNITSQRADLQIEDSRYIGSKFTAAFKHSKIIVGKFESIANEIICKAKNVYNNVEELTQLKTGRMRTLVKSTLHIKSKSSYLKSEEDFKINADKIHLG